MQVKSRLITVATIFLAMATLAATAVYAQQRQRTEPPGPGPGPTPWGAGVDFLGADDGAMRLIRMADRLELTREQRDAIIKLTDEARPALRDNLFKLMDTRKELRELMKGDKAVDDKKLRALTRTQGEAMAEIMYKRLQLQSGIRTVLTPEQLTKVRDFRGQGRRMRPGGMPERGEMQERFRNWRQPGPGTERPE